MSQTDLRFAADGFVCLQNRGQRKVVVVATYYSPQKVRLKEGGERRREAERGRERQREAERGGEPQTVQ